MKPELSAPKARSVALSGQIASFAVNALSDESSRRILVSTVSKGKTAREVSLEQAIPLSTCYRRAHELVDQGLLVVERVVITGDGKRYAVFRSAFRRLDIATDFGELSVSVELNDDVADKFRRKTIYPYS
jgi:hypothetical protein